MSTGIQWTDETWNPIAAFDKVTGKRGWFCTRVSEGCEHCYAEQMNTWRGNGHKYRVPNLDKVEFRLMEQVLVKPLSWREPQRIFVCSMTDLFLDAIPDEWIAQVFAVMACARRHTFQVLTKRPARMQALLSSQDFRQLVAAFVTELAFERSDPHDRRKDDLRALAPAVTDDEDWPLPNVEIGTSVESPRWATERIPLLLETPAAVRFLSCEPLLAAVDVGPYVDGYTSRTEHHPNCDGETCDIQCPIEVQVEQRRVDWVIVGGESGAKARPCDTEWIADIVAACEFAGVPCFVKQMGSRPTTPDLTHWRCGHTLLPDSSGYALKLRDSHGGDPDEWPEELRVREFPASGVRA